MTGLMVDYIRSIEPKATTISIGGEIGHIGGVNSTVADFEAFMDGLKRQSGYDQHPGISKVSVQTGTSHGGIVMPDGTMKHVDVDFSVLKDISEVAHSKYAIGGAVQHGASTLPEDLFNNFPQNSTLEIHLATGFQNIVFDNMPEKLRIKMYDWTLKNCQKEWEEGWSKKQFIYKCRKKALGPFKKDLFTLSEKEKQPILSELEKQFEFLFDKLNVISRKGVIDKYY